MEENESIEPAVEEETITEDAPVVEEAPVVEDAPAEVTEIDAPVQFEDVVTETVPTQADKDLAVLVEARKIMTNSGRYMAVKAIQGAAQI